jgi:hypothetical protein
MSGPTHEAVVAASPARAAKRIPVDDLNCRRTSARVLAAPIARAVFSKTLLSQEGAGECRELAAPMARLQKSKQAADTTGSAKSPGIPCATVLRFIRDLPGARALLPPSPESLVGSQT